MLAKIQKWGNSQGIKIPKVFLKECHITIGDEIDISVTEGNINIKPMAREYDIRELVSGMPRDHKPEEITWGPPVGNEEW